MSEDKLLKAAKAAGFAMAPSDDLMTPMQTAGTEKATAWRAAKPPRPAADVDGRKAEFSWREWFATLAGRATA